MDEKKYTIKEISEFINYVSNDVDFGTLEKSGFIDELEMYFK